MHWRKKYLKAIKSKKQLIGDSVMRSVFYSQREGLFLEEVVFPTFRADIIEFFVNKKDENNSLLIGYEVKSDRDSLDKLEKQLQGYLTWCNGVFVLATLSHKKELLQIVNSNELFKNNVGIAFYKMGMDFRTFETYQKGNLRNLKSSNLSIDWITRKNKLYNWTYFLKDVYGLGV